MHMYDHIQNCKITMHGLPRAQLPISSYGTMYSSRQYDKMIKQKELIAADTQLLYKKQEFTSKMNEISKKKMASKQKWDEVKHATVSQIRLCNPVCDLDKRAIRVVCTLH